MTLIGASFILMLFLWLASPKPVIHAQCGRCFEPIVLTKHHYIHEFDGRAYRTDLADPYIVSSHVATP